MVTLAWHEVLSWGLTLISFTLFIAERRRNDNTKYYMVLQGILRACHQRSGFLASMLGRFRENNRDELVFVVESEYVNYLQLQEQIMGSMKSLQPDKDMPFDVGGFVRGAQAPSAATASQSEAGERRRSSN